MPQRKPLILVVDDDPGILKLVTLNLELEAISRDASDGKTALQMIENEQPTACHSRRHDARIGWFSGVRTRPQFSTCRSSC